MHPFVGLLFLLFTVNAYSGIAEPLLLANGAEIPVERLAGSGNANTRVLWLPSERGLSTQELAVARALARRGQPVWAADLHTAYFLPVGRSSLDQVPVADVVALIEAAGRGMERVVLFSSGRGAALALEAAREWQLAHPGDSRLAGALLLYPNLQAGLPEPGRPPRYRPIVSATNLPLFLLQPALSARRWYLPALAEGLATGGSSVYQRLLPEVSDDFLTRRERSPAEGEMIARLPELLRDGLRLIAAHDEKRLAPAQLAADGVKGGAPAAGLRPHRGDPKPPALELPDLEGATRRLSDLRGEVVLVNFWATWCPPCVREIPSLGRLQQRLQGSGFRVLAVDVGESEEIVRRFLEKRPAAFPVLLDSEGVAVKAWNVSAFPSNFLIDAAGRIRYSYYGALEWDAPEVVELIETLLAERHSALLEANTTSSGTRRMPERCSSSAACRASTGSRPSS